MKIKSLLFLVLITLICAKQLRFLQEKETQYAENGAQMPSEVQDMVQAGMQVLNVINQTGAAKFMGHVGLIIDAAATIIDTFKSSDTRTFEKLVPGEGYESFEAKFEWDFSLGYRWQGYKQWKQQMKEKFKVADEYEKDFFYELDTGGFVGKEVFSSFNFVKDENEKKEPVYDDKGRRVLTFINVLIYKYRKDCKTKFDAIISQADIHVKLFPNKLIFRHDKSIAGGIHQESLPEEQWQDRDFTAKDIDDIVSYFQLSTYNELSKNLGIITSIVL